MHPQRSIITRCARRRRDVEVDVYPVELAPGDRLLLCSDGLTDMVHADDIAATLRREDDPTRAAAAARRRRQRRRRRGQHHRGRRRGHRRSAASREVARGDRADRGRRGRRRAPDPSRASDAGAALATASGRVLLWALPIVLVLGIAVGAVGWYARKNYYVGFDQGRVTVYKGVPGGLAGWDPTIEQRTAVELADLQAGRAGAGATTSRRSRRAPTPPRSSPG